MAILFLAAFVYGKSLIFYLHDLQHPWVMLYAFWMSLGLALLHVINVRAARVSLLRATTLTLSFCLAVWVAHEVRGWYLDALTIVISSPEAIEHIGSDYYGAMSNKAVGYGGCFAIGLLLVRWLIANRVESLLRKLFATKAYFPVMCEHCNQPIYK